MSQTARIIGETFLDVADKSRAAVTILGTLDIGCELAFAVAAKHIEFLAVGVSLACVHGFACTVDACLIGIGTWVLIAALLSVCLIDTDAVDTVFIGIGTGILITAFRGDCLVDTNAADTIFIGIGAGCLLAALSRLGDRNADAILASSFAWRRIVGPDAVYAGLNIITVALFGIGCLADTTCRR